MLALIRLLAYAGAGRPYPFPINAQVEGAWPGCNPNDCDGDRHVLARDNSTCLLYEAYFCRQPSSMSGEPPMGAIAAAGRATHRKSIDAFFPRKAQKKFLVCRAGKWTCGNGAVWNLSSPALLQRPVGWTSADAAGLPIWPGLITTADVFIKKSIDHAIRCPWGDVLEGQRFAAARPPPHTYSHIVSLADSLRRLCAPPMNTQLPTWLMSAVRAAEGGWACGLVCVPATTAPTLALRKHGSFAQVFVVCGMRTAFGTALAR